MAMAVIILVIGLIASTISAPQASLNDASTLKSPSSMTYEELDYILSTKRGETRVQPKILSPCARAILGCCNDKVMNSHCSESLNCGAFFFDNNPCEEQFVVSALKAAKTFYKQFDN